MRNAALVSGMILASLMIGAASAAPQQQPNANAGNAADAAAVANAVLSERFETLASEILRAPQLPDSAWRRSSVFLQAAARLYPAEPRYPRLRALALAHIGDVDATIAALNDYRSLPAGSGDKVAQVQLIDLYVGKIETVDQKLAYVQKLLALPSIAPEVKSFVASKGVALLAQRSADEAARMAEQAVKFYPLPEATRQYYQLVAIKQPLKERVAALLAVLNANPNQPAYIAEVGRQLALAGLTEPAVEWMDLSIRLYTYSRAARPANFHQLLIDYGSELFIAGRVQTADSFIGQLLDQVPDDADAWFLKLVLGKESAEEVAYGQTLELAKSAFISRWNDVSDLILRGAATTRPATGPASRPAATEPGNLEPADPAPVIEKITNEKDPKAIAAVESVVGDLAWFELYFDKQPEQAAKWINVLKAALPEDSVTLLRLQGWQELLAGHTDEARRILAKIADHDPLAKLGLIRADEAEKKPADAEAARQLLSEYRTGLIAAMLWEALKPGQNNAAQTQPATQPASQSATQPATQPSAQEAKEVRQLLDRFASLGWMEILDPQKAPQFYSVRVEPIHSPVPFGEPVLAWVTVQNKKNHDLTIGPDATLRPDLWFNAQILGINAMSFPGAAYDQIANELVLGPGRSTRQIVRLDQGDLRSVLEQLPTAVSTRVSGYVITNPMTAQQGVFPGPGGVMEKFTQNFSYAGVNITVAANRKRIEAIMAEGAGADKIRTMDLLAAYVRAWTSPKADAASRAAAAELMKMIESAQSDTSEAVSSWARFLTVVFSPDARQDSVVSEMMQSKQWETRMLGLLAQGRLRPERQKDLTAALAANDPDPTVKAMAEATAQLLAAAATQPTSPPAPEIPTQPPSGM